jgi:DNA-binding SARP family transcriptional activator/predicted ATPase
MAGLQLRLLGDLEVIRDDAPLELPPSRKTRGLLAYLALADRPRRREQLCELLWEIPDDPRGSLRWSLSKIRKLVDDEDEARIVANRSNVAFDTSTVDIDVLALHRVAASAARASVQELAREAARQGSFLEGIDLANFHEFHTWCIGERERATRSRVRVLEELCTRLAGEPEQALDHAAALVALAPYEEAHRSRLIRLLVQLDRGAEAKHQYRVGREKLAEAGVQDTGELGRALRAPRRRVGGAPPAPAAPGAISTPQQAALVGREREMQRLGERIGRLVSEGTAGVVLIRGEPGIGKSSLLQVAAAMARKAGTRLFKASAFESEMIRPFGVWKDALQRGLPDNNPARQFLDNGAEMTREQVFGALVDIFRVEAAKSPVVILCDDIQWADESSFGAVQYLLRHHPDLPVLFIVASREVELRNHPGAQSVFRNLRSSDLLEEIHLTALAPTHIEQLLRREFPGADAAGLAAECGGNPLLALELARAGYEGGHSLAELVSERMAQLDEHGASVLHWAAVLAPRITLDSLESTSGVAREVIDSALETAELQGILIPGERGLRFSHELIRQSLYDQISDTRRRAMHRQAAELLEVEASVDLDLAADLAHHARLSGDPYLACKAVVSAGKLCIRFYANDQAMELYRQGMALADQLSDAQRICLSLELAELRLKAEPIEDWPQQVDEYVRLAEEALDHGSPPHARLGYQMASFLRWEHGELKDARRFSLQAERVSRGATDAAHILGMAEAAKCLAMLERDLSRADAMAMEARALARRADYACAAIDLSQGMLRYHEDKPDEAVERLEDARARAKADGDRLSEFVANEYLAMVELDRGDYVAAQRYTRNLVDIGERMREGSERPFAQALHALCHCHLTGEDHQLEPALQALRAADAKQRLAYFLNRAARCALEHDRVQAAYAYASDALELARVMERPSEILLACITLERLYRSDPGTAPVSHRDEVEQLTASSVAGWARARGEALLREKARNGEK